MPTYNATGTRCSGKCQPGVQNYRTVLYRQFKSLRPGGCYNCRPVRGGRRLSEHGEGRADDAMTGSSWRRNPEADKLIALLVTHADRLGIQGIIYFRRIWGYGRWYWRDYFGSNPHTDHVHVGFNWGGALNLTVEQVEELLGADAQGGWLMALTDAEQQEVLHKTREMHVFLFGRTSEEVGKETPRGKIFSLTDLFIRLFDHLQIPWK